MSVIIFGHFGRHVDSPAAAIESATHLRIVRRLPDIPVLTRMDEWPQEGRYPSATHSAKRCRLLAVTCHTGEFLVLPADSMKC